MAYDKVVDSSVLDATFTTIANAIRTKTESTETMHPSEMAGLIETNLLKPSGNKNITNTDTTDVTNFATAKVVDPELIPENIKKDVNILGILGSLESAGIEFATGSFVVEANTHNAQKISFNLPELPNFCCVWSEGLVLPTNTNGATESGLFYARDVSDINTYISVYKAAFNSTTTTFSYQAYASDDLLDSNGGGVGQLLTMATTKGASIRVGSISCKWIAGVIYHWAVARINIV